MRAGKLRCLAVMARSAYVTLAISVPTILEVYRGRYRRESGDRRLRWWSRRLLEMAEVEVKTIGGKGLEWPLDRPTIVMSNHSSLYDIPIIFTALPGSIRMLTKSELFRVPIWGRGMRAGEFVSIDRHDRAQAMRDLEEARRKMASGIVLWIAPEGTRSRDGSLGSFKKGGFMLALQAGAVIVPVGIRGAAAVLPSKTLALELGVEVEVHVGEPIDAADYDIEERSELMSEVERRLRRLAGLDF